MTQLCQESKQNSEPLLTIKDACEFLKCSRSTIYRLIDSGALRSVTIRRLRRFKQSDLKECIENHPGS